MWIFFKENPHSPLPVEVHLQEKCSSRMLRDLLRQQGLDVGRLHVGTLMSKMGIEAIYRRPNTSKPTPGQRVYPYLLSNLVVDRPNHVWAMDISYIPMARGFVYLAAVVDWFSRRIPNWKLSITMDVSFCFEAVEEALAIHGRPEILNTDQGSQFRGPRRQVFVAGVDFTSAAFTEQLKKNEIAISMDGKPGSPARAFCALGWQRAAGATMFSWNACGERSSTKRSISGHTRRSRRPEPPSANT
jgi:putative transposase